MRVLVCGDREWNDQNLITHQLQSLHAYLGITAIIEGECQGADIMAREAARFLNIPFEPYPANWSEHKKAAGPIRNTQMLREGKPDLGIAFHDNLYKSKGTFDMIQKMEKAGLKVVKVRHLGLHVVPWPIDEKLCTTYYYEGQPTEKHMLLVPGYTGWQLTSEPLSKLIIKGYVLYSEDAGVYLGHCMGLGFWSKWDPVGQNCAPMFETLEEVQKYLDSVDDPTSLPRFTPVEVFSDQPGGHYVSMEGCVRVGLPGWETEIKKDEQSTQPSREASDLV